MPFWALLVPYLGARTARHSVILHHRKLRPVGVHAKRGNSVPPNTEDFFPKGSSDMHQTGIMSEHIAGLLDDTRRLIDAELAAPVVHHCLFVEAVQTLRRGG